MAINNFGKSAFIRFRDRTGQLQAYVRKDRIGADAYRLFKQLDIGDFVGLKGGLFQTRTGEWTLLANEVELLCKSTRPLPEKFHGLRRGRAPARGPARPFHPVGYPCGSSGYGTGMSGERRPSVPGASPQ